MASQEDLVVLSHPAAILGGPCQEITSARLRSQVPAYDGCRLCNMRVDWYLAAYARGN